MKNTTAIAIATALAVTAVPVMLGYYQSPDEPAPTPEPETPEQAMTVEQKQGLFDSVAIGVYEDIDQVVSYGLISEAQADELKAATQVIVNEIKPDDIVQAFKEAVDNSFYSYVSPSLMHYADPSVYSKVKSAFTDYLSPQLNSFYSMVGGAKGCIGRFDQSETVEMEYDAKSVSAHLPDGVKYTECENGTDINSLVYQAGEADVQVSYDFKHAAVYFKETDPYANESCEYKNNRLYVFTELDGNEGLARAFADKAQAEASLAEIKTQAQAYIAENWPQIQDEMSSATKPAAPAPR